MDSSCAAPAGLTDGEWRFLQVEAGNVGHSPNIKIFKKLLSYQPLQYTVCMYSRYANMCWYITRAGNLLIHSSLIRSSLIRSFAHFAQIKWATVSDLLRLLKTNERPWANSSEEMSKVAQDKWATVSDSLRLLTEKMSKWAICSKNVGKQNFKSLF